MSIRPALDWRGPTRDWRGLQPAESWTVKETKSKENHARPPPRGVKEKRYIILTKIPTHLTNRFQTGRSLFKRRSCLTVGLFGHQHHDHIFKDMKSLPHAGPWELMVPGFQDHAYSSACWWVRAQRWNESVSIHLLPQDCFPYVGISTDLQALAAPACRVFLLSTSWLYSGNLTEFTVGYFLW